MAPLPASNTARFKVSYTNQLNQHAAVVRSTPVSPATFGTQFDALMTALVGIIPTTVIDVVEFAASGSDIFNPVVTGIEGNSYGAGPTSERFAAHFLSFIGRTSGGRRVRLFIFGIDALVANDYRYVSGEIPQVDAAIAVIAGATGSFLGIDGLIPSWKSYANTGVNTHWQKELRP